MLVAVTDRTKVECGMCWTTAALAVEESSREFKREREGANAVNRDVVACSGSEEEDADGENDSALFDKESEANGGVNVLDNVVDDEILFKELLMTDDESE
ncbi:hypothetical protein EVAR_66590_1 [Eumeta japonica]|uniref:Peptidase C1A papain C-terminal domain-containing protein n=1 Tax=Eumeta variegata TaxID=151549 RepID=A0A4C2A8N9_EUMVA|nr:hypothetical protein EVAR_66590_1 [Eumeta japonica]